VWEGDSGACETEKLCKYFPAVSFGKEVFCGQRRGMMVACYSALHPVFILFFLLVHSAVRLPGAAS